MAKVNLTELIEWLRQDDKNRFEIYDLDRNESIENCASYAELTERYGSPMAYFESLPTRGIYIVQVVKKRKNGSTYIRQGCGLNYSLSTGTEANNNVAASGLPDLPAATTQQPSRTTGLAGAHAGSAGFGLGFPEIMALGSRADRYEDAKMENQELKAKLEKIESENKIKVERLEAENKKLENECLKHQFGIESKPSAVDKLVEAIAANPTVIPSMIQSFKGVQPGLNSPQIEGPKLSAIKSYAVDLIKKTPDLPDDVVNAATHVLVQSQLNNNEFIDEFIALLQKHNL